MEGTVRMDLTQARLRARSTKALIALLAATGLAALTPLCAPAAAETGFARIEPACPAPQPGEASCFALVRHRVAASEARKPGVHPFALRTGAASSGPAGGLAPAQLASAYGYDPSSGGSGQTVGIVDAFDDPNIESDLKEFDVEYGLPACTEANGCFKKVGQTGKTTSLPAADKTGWSVEISLDVETVHAACPSCHILLVEAENTFFSNLGASVKKAVELGATEVSNSYGGPERSGVKPSPTEIGDYDHPGVVIAAATGDFGYDWWTGPLPDPETANVPSTLRSVVAVGGTTLTLDSKGRRASETVWNGNGELNEGEFSEGASGGGCSIFFEAPLWQRDVPGFGATGCGAERLAADVAAVADPLTGFDIFDTYNCGLECEHFKQGANWVTIGGTSLSTPLISALYGLAGGGAGVSYPALTLYGHLGDSSLFDVTEGGNGYCDDGGLPCGVNEAFGERLDCEGTTACNAAKGFDGPSGVGTPASLALFKPLLPTAAITLPTKLVSGTPLTFSAAGSSDPYPGGAVGISYSWTFSDGGGASGITAGHTYSAPGKFTVTLTVTDGYGFKSAPRTVELAVTERTAKEIKEEEEEAAKHKAEEEAKHKAEEEAAKHKAEEEAKHKAEEEAAKHKAEEAAKHKAEEEAARKVVEEAAARVKAAEEAARSAAGSHPPGTGSTGIASFTAANPAATLAGTSLQATANGTFTVKISCPAGETSCEGTVTVQTAGAVVASARARVLTLAVGHFKVAGGKMVTVKLRLNAKAVRLLGRKHTLRVRVTIASHDPAGASHTGGATASLRAPKKHH